MKVKDLMIGDWVLAEGKLTQVTDIDKYDGINRRWIAGCEDGGCIPEKDIEPIPLTPEILEKNGFGFIDTSNGEYSSIWTGWWIFKGLELGCCDNSKFPVFFNIADTNVKVNYVHKLQHALKMCGIKKKIVL